MLISKRRKVTLLQGHQEYKLVSLWKTVEAVPQKTTHFIALLGLHTKEMKSPCELQVRPSYGRSVRAKV